MHQILGKHFEFFCLKWRILVYFIFLSDGRAPKRRRVQGNLPLNLPFSPLDEPACELCVLDDLTC